MLEEADLDKIRNLAKRANQMECQCGGQCEDEHNRQKAIEGMHKSLTPSIVMELLDGKS